MLIWICRGEVFLLKAESAEFFARLSFLLEHGKKTHSCFTCLNEVPLYIGLVCIDMSFCRESLQEFMKLLDLSSSYG